MKIVVFGTRGFPHVQGGVEKHCEELYTSLSEAYQVTVFRRKPYVSPAEGEGNVRFMDLPSTRIKGFEAFFHSFLCTLYCLAKRPDVVHIHNIGPGLFIPLLKLAGLKTVLTYHSANYEHDKWGFLAKKFLKASEYLAIRGADAVIFVNRLQREKFPHPVLQKSVYLPNGIRPQPPATATDYLSATGLQPYRYVLAVGRITPEKGFDYLMDAFSRLNEPGLRLVIAGGIDHTTPYSRQFQQKAEAAGVVLTGYTTGEDLRQLYSFARLFVLPSFHEGYPIVLVEAINYGKPILASDIPANRQLELPAGCYFPVGSVRALEEQLRLALAQPYQGCTYAVPIPSWEEVAAKVARIYDSFKKQ